MSKVPFFLVPADKAIAAVMFYKIRPFYSFAKPHLLVGTLLLPAPAGYNTRHTVNVADHRGECVSIAWYLCDIAVCRHHFRVVEDVILPSRICGISNVKTQISHPEKAFRGIVSVANAVVRFLTDLRDNVRSFVL